MSVGPGATAFTSTCRGASSRAQERVEGEHRCLAGGINRSILAPDIGELGGEIDDARAIRQVGQGFARDQNCAAYVYGEMLVNQIGGGFSE